MEAITDWIDYKITRCADKLERKYNIEKRIDLFDSKINKKLESDPDLIWKIAFGSVGLWVLCLVSVTLFFFWIF